MTQTVERRPLTRPAPPPRRTGSVLVPGAVSAAWALGAGLVAIAVPVLLAWATDSRSGSGAADATRTAGQLWLLAHGAALAVPGGIVGLTPLGLILLPLGLLHRAGRHAVRIAAVDAGADAVTLALAIAVPYAVAAGFMAALCATDAVRPAPVSALLGAFAVALTGAGSGVLREAGLLGQISRLPERVRRLAAAAAAAVAVLIAAGAALAGASLAGHADRATSLARASDPGLVGGLTLFLLCLLLVPNAAVWGAAFVTGPGFAVGVGTSVDPFGTTLGPVPAVPVLAALPGGDVPLWLGIGVLAVPLVAGVIAGLLVGRRAPGSSALNASAEALLVGPCVGAALALLAYLSGGPLGGGRLADVGPSPWQVGLAVALEVGLTAAVTAAAVVRARR
jgi:hypothetical protein